MMLVLGPCTGPTRTTRGLAAYDDACADVALQVGDLQLYDLPVETWFIAGNNEDFDIVEALREAASPPGTNNVHLLASEASELEGLRIAGPSGNYAPRKYDLPRSELLGDRRRHFTCDDVERLAAIEDLDVLLTHEAPRGLLYYGYDPGCDHANDLLDATTRISVWSAITTATRRPTSRDVASLASRRSGNVTTWSTPTT